MNKSRAQGIFATKNLVLMAMLIALNIILSRFLSVAAWNIKIGFAFLPVVIAAIYLGPLQAAIVGGVGDFLGAMIFPIAAYFPGFTVTAFFVGLTYGLFLHKKQSILCILGAVVLTELVGSLLLNTLWISMLFGSPFLPLMVTRLVQVCAMSVVEIISIRVLCKLPVHVQHA